MKQMPLSLRALSSFGFSFFHSCFSRFWAALPILAHTSGRSGLVVVWTFVNLHPDHKNPLGCFSCNRMNFVKPFHKSDKLLLESTFQQSSTGFSCMTSRSKYVDLVTSMYFSGIRNVSSFGTYSWTRGSLWWTIDEVTLNRPEVGTGFSVICWFCRWTSFRVVLKFSTEIFAPYRLFPPQTGFSECAVSSSQFCCTIFYWEYEFISCFD